MERFSQQRGWAALSKRPLKLKIAIELIPQWGKKMSVVARKRQDGKGSSKRMVGRGTKSAGHENMSSKVWWDIFLDSSSLAYGSPSEPVEARIQ